MRLQILPGSAWYMEIANILSSGNHSFKISGEKRIVRFCDPAPCPGLSRVYVSAAEVPWTKRVLLRHARVRLDRNVTGLPWVPRGRFLR